MWRSNIPVDRDRPYFMSVEHRVQKQNALLPLDADSKKHQTHDFLSLVLEVFIGILIERTEFFFLVSSSTAKDTNDVDVTELKSTSSLVRKS